MKQRVLEAYGKLPLAFVPNVGQEEREIAYYAQGNGFRFDFIADRVRMTFYDIKPERDQERNLRGVTMTWRFLNAKSDVSAEGAAPDNGKINYLRGRTSKNRETKKKTAEKTEAVPLQTALPAPVAASAAQEAMPCVTTEWPLPKQGGSTAICATT
ncbi:DUF7948 domain-containing protein [Paenibacillus harenae]|uniref:DUF7948 domain-containing protein n=1 Tax=Paenibacillus harenae TaxID=306543 RepID=A0ABT9TY90_PAEHA|nr:hypothetical protein [Paenibacillus harenae]MDQ0112335.1 hypothetical protein [Paenibacillus harenae]